MVTMKTANMQLCHHSFLLDVSLACLTTSLFNICLSFANSVRSMDRSNETLEYNRFDSHKHIQLPEEYLPPISDIFEFFLSPQPLILILLLPLLVLFFFPSFPS